MNKENEEFEKNRILESVKILMCNARLNQDYFAYEIVYNLLSLYNKEKEKNKLLIESKFKEIPDICIKDIFIAKYKIREKIDELDNFLCATHEERDEHLYAMEVLKELLEEK